MKKFLCLALSVLMALAMFAGCTKTTDEPSNDTTTPPSTNESTDAPSTNEPTETPAESGKELSGVVNTDGSTSMADVMAVLQETFKELHPDVTVNYAGTGSGAGIEAVLAGTADIGLASRALKDEE